MDEKTFQLDIGARDLEVKIPRLAEQANGSVFVRYGETLILVTAVMSKEDRTNVDFFPLTVEYGERFYAAGKIKGPRYIKRETRPSDEAIVTSRLIDRTIRPLFPKELKREVQVIITCLSYDLENDPDILGVIGSSLALGISDIPWQGPVAAVRVGRGEKGWILNPINLEREKSSLDIVFAGLERNGEIIINMIEGHSEETKEELILEAWEFAKPYLKQLINFQKRIISEIGQEKLKIEPFVLDPQFEKELKGFLEGKIEKALFKVEKFEKMSAMDKLRDGLVEFIKEKYPEDEEKIRRALDFFTQETRRILHQNVIKKEKRPDGREIEKIRKISMEVGVLPRTHGSGLFCRGQTKSLSILTLGAPGDQQLLEGMEIVGKKRFMHHYNFPPYSTGEIRPSRAPSRREIGHGILAERALLPLIPLFDDFPYTMRVVSEILSSNGSTSMASVCSSSLALMDAGVPIKAPVAGIALGLMKEGNNYKILTDIQGPEDHFGDMDFKIAGTREGITALQMDVKIEGIDENILKESLERGRKARLEILDLMEKVIAKPRSRLSPFAPRIFKIQISPEKIRDVIGPGGKTINDIIEKCEVSIDIQPDGLIFVTAEKEEAAKKAIAWIKNLTREIKAGETFYGKVKRIYNFGAILELVPNQEGLLHISQLKPYRIKRVEEAIKVGDVLPVKVISIDEHGRINLGLSKRIYFKRKKR